MTRPLATGNTRPLTGHELAGILTRLDTIVGQAIALVPASAPGEKITTAERARRRAATFAPGPKSGLGGGGRRGAGEVNRPTEAAALAPTDPSERWVLELAVAARAADWILAVLADTIIAVNAHAAHEYDDGTGTRTARLGAGLCLACEHDATGVGDDRLRGGLCDADRKRWQREQASYGYDRGSWIRERRVENDLDPLTPEQRSMRNGCGSGAGKSGPRATGPCYGRRRSCSFNRCTSALYRRTARL